MPEVTGAFDGTLHQSADLLVVVPPFAGIDRPAFGASIIADVARREGLKSQVVYANLDFARTLGATLYQKLCHAPTGLLIGEQIFGAGWAGRGPRSPDATTPEGRSAAVEDTDLELRKLLPEYADPLTHLQELADQWADRIATRLSRAPAPMIGFTTVFEQTLASLTLIERVERAAPGKTLLLGGANVDGELAAGVASIARGIDFIFSGESEKSFRRFLRHPPTRTGSATIIESAGPHDRLDEIPVPCYDDYFEQVSAIFGDAEAALIKPQTWLPYETSRGCWWGQKHHCTFCGLNAEGMAFRSKSPGRVVEDLDTLRARYRHDRILMVDNIMPHQYFATLLPQLASRESRFHLFYEQKANLSFHRMKILTDAGVRRIQPGIEALNSALLSHMRKGVTARQNIECLRYARALGVDVAWNLLLDFPGDEAEWYAETAKVIPYLTHLQPPSGCSPLSIDRFSPYFDSSDRFGISDLRPIPAYALAFGDLPSLPRIAYHFQGEYASAARDTPGLARRLFDAVAGWQAAWSPDVKPLLQVIPLSPERYLLIDTRPDAAVDAQILDRAHARAVLRIDGETEGELWDWAREGGYAIELDGRRVPLAVGSRECLDEFSVP